MSFTFRYISHRPRMSHDVLPASWKKWLMSPSPNSDLLVEIGSIPSWCTWGSLHPVALPVPAHHWRRVHKTRKILGPMIFGLFHSCTTISIYHSLINLPGFYRPGVAGQMTAQHLLSLRRLSVCVHCRTLALSESLPLPHHDEVPGPDFLVLKRQKTWCEHLSAIMKQSIDITYWLSISEMA